MFLRLQIPEVEEGKCRLMLVGFVSVVMNLLVDCVGFSCDCSAAWSFVKIKSCELCCKHTCQAMVFHVEIAARFDSMLDLAGGLPAICYMREIDTCACARVLWLTCGKSQCM